MLNNYLSDVLLKRENLIGCFIFTTFLYGINSLIKYSIIDHNDNEIKILMQEMNELQNNSISDKNCKNNLLKENVESNDILECAMVQTIENDIIMVEKLIEKKDYLINLNNKLIKIKQRLKNLKVDTLTEVELQSRQGTFNEDAFEEYK